MCAADNPTLEEQLSRYLVKQIKNGGLLDPINHTLEFYPAGFSKDGRQDLYKILYDCAVDGDVVDKIYPWKGYGFVYQLDLVRQDNEYDPFATKIMQTPGIRTPAGDSSPSDLGWVPASMSKIIATNIDRFYGGEYLKVKNDAYDKFYSAKVIFKYRPTILRPQALRLRRIMQETK